MKVSNNQRGFTMIELLVGMLAAAILSYAALSLYTTQHKHMLVQDEIADMQGNLRSSAEVLAKSIRKAGYNLPDDLLPIEHSDTNPDTIVVTYDTGILAGIELLNDIVDPGDELWCTREDVSGLEEGQWAYIYDPTAETGEFFVATRVLTGPARIQHSTMPFSHFYPAGSKILKLARIKYFVDSSDSTGTNLLIQTYGSQPEIFAENIANLNFRYFLASGAVVTAPANPADIRLVEIDIEGRTESPDPALFNQYRTRNFTLRVNVRNLGLSQL
ncbi:MAG: prepilin-type N-terminal cleavage/methylation domain-containing protein [candidate division Zixibacteria bacterium]